MKFYLLIIFLISISFSSTQAQISPGDLTKAHAELEGMSNCTKCHVIGEQVYNSNCLNCHKEIASTLNLNRGYHSSKDVLKKDCWDCHSEHHGRNFRIVNFDPDKFDHSKTSFSLTGKHAEIECESCHQPKFIKDASLKKREGTFLGMDTDCLSCHEDYHNGNLGENCSSCHSTESFKRAEKFDHNKTEFKLTGAHIKVDCGSCHKTETKSGKKIQTFSIVSFASCASCHKDVHNGKFGVNCESCHATNSFHQINQASFDHDKTDFPLLGKHKNVSCNDCHKKNLTEEIKHDKCIDCHKDFHKGEFAEGEKITDCNECHTVEKFNPSTFTIVKHQKIEFLLTGAHLAVPCVNCHFKESEWKFTSLNTSCISCHKNVHGNEIADSFMENDNCQKCHSTKDWVTISFDHNKTEFKLLGKHAATSCAGCHYKTINGKKEFKFASLRNECTECHKDIHFGQFASEGKNVCEKCHYFDSWKPEKFDHEKTSFPLRGAHAKLNCSSCHKSVEKNGNKFVKFKLEDFKCAACHFL